jgi:hypothetical protein
MMDLPRQERFARTMHRIATSDWLLAALGALPVIIGIIAAVNHQG